MSRPTLDDLLSDIAGIIIDTPGHRLPPQIQHARPRESAEWLLKVLTCDRPVPGPRRIGRGENARWDWPERLHYATLAMQYLSLDADFQSLIVAAFEDGIQWRGDGRRMFDEILTEHERMLEMGVEAYRQQAISRMRKFSMGA